MEDRVKLPNKDAAKAEPASRTTTKGKPRLLLMGQRHGKSSISSVVFHKMPPHETIFLESTTRLQKDAMHSFMDFQVWDFPGQVDFLDPSFDLDVIFGEIGALIWVIDAQDQYLEAITRLTNTVLNLQPAYPHVNIEVFIHKVDGLSEDYSLDVKRDIVQRIQDELSDHGLDNAPISYHTTSIYDHSIFEAFSRVIQKLVPHLSYLEALLTDLAQKSGFDKVYLFDVFSKIYIATDASPVDLASYELCSDFIDVVIDITEIYDWDRPEEYIKELEGPPYNKKLEDQVASPQAEASCVLSEGQRPIVLREVNKYLALVAVCKEGLWAKKPIIDENVKHSVKGILAVFDIAKNGVPA